ncbi:hypothetical protein [Peribacillus sp. SI8-4]|nr:hypothetical protein [Peribacillus sp. SI8-4]
MYDNPTSRDFLAQSPLTITFEDNKQSLLLLFGFSVCTISAER